MIENRESLAVKFQINSKEPVVSMRGIKKSFGTKQVLSNINMDLLRGENLVILGKSGTGKSVAIKCIVGLLTQEGGSLKIFGREVKELNEDELKSVRIKIGFLFQSAALYDSMTVEQNLEFPLTRVLKM